MTEPPALQKAKSRMEMLLFWPFTQPAVINSS